MNSSNKIKKLTMIAMMCAFAYVIMLVARIPVVLFLKYEPKDVIITIGGFIFGPFTSFLISIVVAFIEMITVSETGIIGFIIGMYDGLIGPGTGTFLIFAYTMVIGFDYIKASGNAKIINLSSNVAAAVSYLLAGKIMWAFVVPAAASNMLGNYLGSSYAIKHGSKAVKKMLIVVLVGIFIKLITDII